LVSPGTRIAFVGLGYVGLSTAVCLASRGFRVDGVDVDQARVRTIAKGVSPIHEAGLESLLRASIRKKTLSLGYQYKGIDRSKVIFLTVGTPSRDDGSIDTSYIEAAAKEIGRQLSLAKGYHLVVVKSTVIPGTTEGLVRPILEKSSGKKVGKEIGLASNPEFLHEGSAIRETLHPEALVIGGVDKRSTGALLKLYADFYRKSPLTILTTPTNAEMTKYAINVGRAAQLSFVNTLADLCTRIPGCDYDEVRKGLSVVAKMDERYLSPGLGFGGSCVPPYTRVVTDSGYRTISSVSLGDRVLSHDGRYHKVTRTFTRDYDGMMYLFKSQGFSSTPLLVTPEHPILSCLRNTGTRPRFYETTIPRRGVVQKMTNAYLIEPPRFADPASLSHGDFMVLPAFKEESGSIPTLRMLSARRSYNLPLCTDLLYLFGLWLAEGIVDTKTGEVLFSLHAKETQFLREIDSITRRYLGVRARVKKSSSKKNSLVVRVKSKALALFLQDTFGHRAENKLIPWDWLGLPSELLISLLRGMWYGDGSNRNTEPYHRFTYGTTSAHLADFVEVAFLKLRAPYRRLVSKERTGFDGTHHRQAYYILGVDNSIMNRLFPRLRIPLATQAHKTSWFENDNFVVPIKDVQVVRYAGKVHNLEVEGSNSYVVAGATLHNCLPKDLRALLAALRKAGVSDEVVSSVLKVNDGQVAEAIRLAERLCGSLETKKVAVLGLAFKADTDDIRESSAISLIKSLVRIGAEITVYDPVAMENTKKVFGSQVSYARSARECIRGAVCAFVATGWDQFRRISPKDFRALMGSPNVVDGRRIYDQGRFLKAGVNIATIGTGPVHDGRTLPSGGRPSKEKSGEYSYSQTFDGTP
jgi:UDP-glucose 6-dehydrogenase